MLAAGFPELGIGFAGVALAFGLTVLTMVYAVGPISGGHFNPAVSLGLAVGGRFSWSELIPYWIAQVVGGIVAAVVLYLIASGKADWTAGGFASNGYGALLARRLRPLRLLPDRDRADRRLPDRHPRLDHVAAGARRLRRHRHRPGADPHPPRLDPGDQHLGQPGALHRRRASSPRPAPSSQLWLFWVAPLIGAALGAGIWAALFAEEPTCPRRQPAGKSLPGPAGLASARSTGPRLCIDPDRRPGT